MIRKLVYISLIVLLGGKSFHCQAGTGMENTSELRSIGTLNFLFQEKESADVFISEFSSLLTILRSKRDRFTSDRQFLQYIYRTVHRKSLKKYRKYVTLDETLGKTGYYDCLTGTLLYSLLLDELGYKVTIREFSYHVLLIVHLQDHKIMIESTDPLDGFVVGEKAIDHQINEYKTQDASRNRNSAYEFNKVIDQEITIAQLVGLHFYNQAINHMNQFDFQEALLDISKAYALFPCDRIKEVSKLISSHQLKNLVAASN